MARSKKVERWIVLPDIHVPYEDKKTLAVVEKYMADQKWDGYIQLGDLLDLDSISRFSEGLAGEIENLRVDMDFDRGYKLLKRHRQIVGDHCEMVMLEGNHEFRVDTFYAKYPQLRGLLDVERNLKLKELGIKWVMCYTKGAVFRRGRALFHHGLYCNKYHAEKHSSEYGENIFYGHVHDVQGISRVRAGKDETYVGQSLGCLCSDQRYMRGKPDKWQQAFGVFHFFPDGFFNYFVVRIFKNRFVSPEGKTYK